MNRNVLKIIAVISMTIDHIGLFFFDNLFILRVIGRLAYPIFAFFIAEGLIHTRNRKKYCINLLICAIITQIPYAFLFNYLQLNVIFTFLVAILFVYLVENKSLSNYIKFVLVTLITIFVLLLDFLSTLDYGLLGVALVLAFYFIKNKNAKFLTALGILLLMTVKSIILSGFSIWSTIQIYALISLALLMLYNNEKGKYNLKHFFYLFYPTHFYIIWITLLLM